MCWTSEIELNIIKLCLCSKPFKTFKSIQNASTFTGIQWDWLNAIDAIIFHFDMEHNPRPSKTSQTIETPTQYTNFCTVSGGGGNGGSATSVRGVVLPETRPCNTLCCGQYVNATIEWIDHPKQHLKGLKDQKIMHRSSYGCHVLTGICRILMDIFWTVGLPVLALADNMHFTGSSYWATNLQGIYMSILCMNVWMVLNCLNVCSQLQSPAAGCHATQFAGTGSRCSTLLGILRTLLHQIIRLHTIYIYITIIIIHYISIKLSYHFTAGR